MSDLNPQVCCPLCHGERHGAFHEDKHRVYLRCFNCHLVFVPPEYYLTEAQEKAEYDLHDNKLDDQGYRQFLSRLWTPLKALFAKRAQILEFGCGPGPALAAMMREDGMQVSLYDHFYYPDQSVLASSRYDGITSTEVIEHLHNPKHVFEQWLNWLKPSGVLGVMTKLVKDQQAFAKWHYKNDLTHVCFFSTETFNWLANRYGLQVAFHGQDVMIFTRS